MRPDLDLSEQPLLGAAEDADAGGLAVAREQQVVLLVDEYPGDAGQPGSERRNVRASQSSTSTRSAPVWATYIRRPGTVGVGVVEAPLRPGRDRDEADADEAHAAVLPASTSALHQA